jgi:hypothetical protein
VQNAPHPGVIVLEVQVAMTHPVRANVGDIVVFRPNRTDVVRPVRPPNLRDLRAAVALGALVPASADDEHALGLAQS